MKLVTMTQCSDLDWGHKPNFLKSFGYAKAKRKFPLMKEESLKNGTVNLKEMRHNIERNIDRNYYIE